MKLKVFFAIFIIAAAGLSFYQEGIKAGVTETPGSFVNGEEIPGAVSYDYLKNAVERALGNL